MMRFSFAQLRRINFKEYLIRFLFGGTVSVIATLIGQWTTTRIGGIFTAFPAILLASLTLIGREDGKRASRLDARGAVIGSIALLFATLFFSLTLNLMAGIVSLLLGLGVWLVCSLGIYVLSVKLGWLKI